MLPVNSVFFLALLPSFKLRLHHRHIPLKLVVTVSSCAFSGDIGHRVLVQITGGAGFVGSHLTDKLMMDGHEVTVVDNFFTGRKRNVEHWIGHENFELINHDVVEPLYIEGERKCTLTAH